MFEGKSLSTFQIFVQVVALLLFYKQVPIYKTPRVLGEIQGIKQFPLVILMGPIKDRKGFVVMVLLYIFQFPINFTSKLPWAMGK